MRKDDFKLIEEAYSSIYEQKNQYRSTYNPHGPNPAPRDEYDIGMDTEDPQPFKAAPKRSPMKRFSGKTDLSKNNNTDEFIRLEREHGGLDWSTAEVEGVHSWDSPDFSDAFLTSISFNDGMPVPDDVVEAVQEAYPYEFRNVIDDMSL